MKITAALIGAGGRGQFSYAPYALQNPNEIEFVAVAEPRDFLRKEFVNAHHIHKERAFESWEKMLKCDQMADCLLICTQDTMHVEPALLAIKKGYKYILLEKPIDPDLEQCKKLATDARENDVNIQICHSLRYTPYFRKLKDVLDSNIIGDIVNIINTEGVGFFHYAHSYVRGDWANTNDSSPMILAKCCHDMDIILYLTGKNCRSISSYGKLSHFTLKNAPEGSTARCTDNCKVKETCPYNAERIYTKFDDFKKLACEKEGFSELNQALQVGRYGKCVYRCDNNAVDHQTVNMLFENDLSVVLTMSAFSHKIGRTIRIMGTMGEIIGDVENSVIEVHRFASNQSDKIEVQHSTAGHHGADEIMMQDFVDLVTTKTGNASSIGISIQSHAMCHAAEVSRHEKRTVELSELLF
jgi:predicted dehydrogenase